MRNAQTTGSSSFALQLEALLASTLLPSTPQAALKSLLSSIHSRIRSLPILPPLAPREAVKRISMTFPGPEEFSPLRKGAEVQWTLGWERPSEVFVGGSWPVCGGYRKGKGQLGGIDMVVVMPQVGKFALARCSWRFRRCFRQRTGCHTGTSINGRTTSPLSALP